MVRFLSFSYSQEVKWNTYDLDSIVYLDLPNTVYDTDTIINNIKNYKIFTDTDSSNFVALKLDLTHASNIEFPKPTDEKSLYKFYSNLTGVLTEITDYDSELKIRSTKKIEIANYKGLKILLEDKNKIETIEFRIFFKNPSLYAFVYTNNMGLDKKDATLFFDSIQIDESNLKSQFKSKPWYSMSNLLVILLLSLFLSFLIRLRRKRRYIN